MEKLVPTFEAKRNCSISEYDEETKDLGEGSKDLTVLDHPHIIKENTEEDEFDSDVVLMKKK